MNWSGRSSTFAAPPPWRSSGARINADGSFEFNEDLPAGEYVIVEQNGLKINFAGGGYSQAILFSDRGTVVVEPGRTTFVNMPAGRSVIGKVDLGSEENLRNVHYPIVSLISKQEGPDLKFPGIDRSLSDEENFKRWQEFREKAMAYWFSDEGKARRRAERAYEISTEDDGSFRFDNVAPGTYRLEANAQRWDAKPGPDFRREITVSDSPLDVPLDLGTLK
jgi:hypothetical protein